jgi:hypothetical protein
MKEQTHGIGIWRETNESAAVVVVTMTEHNRVSAVDVHA